MRFTLSFIHLRATGVEEPPIRRLVTPHRVLLRFHVAEPPTPPRFANLSVFFPFALIRMRFTLSFTHLRATGVEEPPTRRLVIEDPCISCENISWIFESAHVRRHPCGPH